MVELPAEVLFPSGMAELSRGFNDEHMNQEALDRTRLVPAERCASVRPPWRDGSQPLSRD